MRSSAILTSAMAMGAVASPLGFFKRDMVTVLDLDIKTVTVYVTPGQLVPTPEAYGVQPAKPSTSTTCLEGETSTPAPAPAPAPSSQAPAPAPVPSSSSVYVPPVVTPTPTPSPSPEYPASSAPEPTSSAPAATSATPSASSTPDYGTHESGEGQAELSSGPEYKAAVLYHHNVARANHDASPLVWDDLCEENARVAASQCNFEHFFPNDNADRQGQNLFTVSGDAFNVTAGIYESWYKNEFKIMTENSLWGLADIPDSIFHEVGHLTQMLWKETTKVGCVSLDCGSQMTINGASSELNKYTVCNYASAGNGAGEYATNVGLPKSTVLGSWSD